jgi:undecaprenyl-diphosphatase
MNIAHKLCRTLLIVTVLVAVASPLRAQNWDYSILYGLQQRRTPSADVAMKWVSNSVWLTPLTPLGMAVGGWAADDRTLLNNSATVGCTWLGTIGLTIGTKYIVRRPRPYQAYPDVLLPLTTEPDPSFPSGHTSMAFCTATSLSLLYPHWYVVVPSMLWATTVGFSRLYLGVHYPSDVLTGALLGAGVAVVAYNVAQRRQEESLIMPSGKAVVVPISFHF